MYKRQVLKMVDQNIFMNFQKVLRIEVIGRMEKETENGIIIG